MLLVGESSGFTSAEHVLMRSYVSPAVFVWSAMPCMPVCMFGMPARFLSSTWLHLPTPIGKFCICMVFRHVLMDSVISVVISMLCAPLMHLTSFQGHLSPLHCISHLGNSKGMDNPCGSWVTSTRVQIWISKLNICV